LNVSSKRRETTKLPSLDQVRAEKARRSLVEFVRQAFPVVEPATTYQHNWHIDLICGYLEAASRGEIRNLLITIPPRMMKSLTVSVFWPAWVWISDPSRRFLYSSYSADLAVYHSVECRRLVESDWYRRNWGHRFWMAEDQNVKQFFENSSGGSRLASGVTGRITGRGGHFLICDDPHKITEGESEAERLRVINWWDREFSYRLNDPSFGARVIIMQRVHEGDLAGHVLSQEDWTHICFPNEFEPEHPQRSAQDPRSEPGELLWPTRFDPQWTEKRKQETGSYAYAGLFQQRPAPAEGGILKRDWWRYYSDLPQVDEVVQSWDMAFKDAADADYVVGQVWVRNEADVYLVRQMRGRFDFPTTVQRVLDLTAWVEERFPEHSAHAIYVEDAANGPAVISSLRRRIPSLIAVKPEGPKEARAHAVAPQLEAGNVFLPGAGSERGGYDRTQTAAWVQGFVEECTAFPNAVHDDQVDAMTQALIRLRQGRRHRVRTGGYDPEAFADR
jgi:predicted phage terminase large subunit-like protein